MRYLGLILLLCGLVFKGYAHDPVKHITYSPPHLIRFTKNKTQWDKRILFKADLPNGIAYLEQDAFTYILLDPFELGRVHPNVSNLKTIHGQVMRQHFLNAHTKSIEGGEKYPDYANYFIGKDPAHWSVNVPIHKDIYYTGLYNHIDMRVYSSYNYILKYDVILHSGANVNDIAIGYEGADKVTLKQGNLLLYTSTGTYTEEKPYAYQLIDGNKITVPCKFILSYKGDSKQPTLTYKLGSYDTRYDVVIDPSLVFSTYTGSTLDDWGYTATYDNQGNMFLGGLILGITTGATGYPTTTGAFQTTFQGGSGAYNGSGKGIGYACDMGITKFNNTGSALIYSTYLGGTDNESPHSLICDSLGNLYIYGVSYSTDFPVTSGCYNPTGDANGDIVVVKMNSAGTALLGSTYIGGSGSDGINYAPGEFSAGNLKANYGDQNRGEINIDTKGDIVVATCTQSTDFPTTAGVFQPASGSTQDGVVFKFNNLLTSLLWASYIGGGSDDAAYSVEIAKDNTLYVTGGTMSNNFPTTAKALNPAYLGGNSDGFVAHISADGSKLLQSTYLGTSGDDQTYFVQLDKQQNVYFIGQTNGTYPTTPGVYRNPNSGQFISKITPTLDTVLWATVVGNGNGAANISPTAFLVDTCQNIYLVGWGTNSSIFTSTTPTFYHDMIGMPLTSNAYQSTTDGTDFYIMILRRNAAALLYGTYFGGNGAIEHVDGGTSRFDKNGYIYEAICAGCIHGQAGVTANTPTTNGVWSTTDKSFNCNELGFKFKLDVTKITAALSAAPRATGCVPLNVQFVNNSTNAYDYVWSFGDGSNDTTTFAPSHIYKKVGTYTVTLVAHDPTGCSIPDTAYTTVTVKNYVANANYVLTQQDLCDSFLLAGTAGANSSYAQYKWTFSTGDTSTNSTFNYTLHTPGTYTLKLVVTDTSACNPIDSLTKTIVYNSKILAGVKDTAFRGCPPLKVFLQNNSIGGLKTTWLLGNGASVSNRDTLTYTYTQSGIYIVKLVIYDSTSCNKTDTAYVRVTVKNQYPNATFTIAPQDKCDSFIVTCTAGANTPSALYKWKVSDGHTSTNNNIKDVFTIPGTYTVTLIVSDTATCHKTDTTTQTILYNSKILAEVKDTAFKGCAPLKIFLSNNSIGGAKVTWYLGNGTIITQRDTFSYTYTQGGVYKVKLLIYDSTSCNKYDSAFVRVTVLGPAPIANFTMDSAQTQQNINMHFTNTTTGIVDAYGWDFGDGTSSTDVNPVHSYKADGTYTICLVAAHNGCHTLACKTLVVKTVGAIGVPNAFSPNGDGKNDILFIKGQYYNDIDFKVFNRWGQLVFESNDYANGWDGTLMNDGKHPQEMDVYVWTLSATDPQGKHVFQKGNVTLLR